MLKGLLKKFRDKVLLPIDNSVITYMYYLGGHRVRFVPVAVLACDMAEWVETLPHDIDVVVGIPRQGMIPATFAALYLGKPLSTPDLIVEGRYWQSEKIDVAQTKVERILLVDDCYTGGKQFEKVFGELKAALPGKTIIPAVPFAQQNSWEYAVKPKENVEPITSFWTSLMHTPVVVVFDLDGVLCEDPPKDLDGQRLGMFYAKAKPLRIPTFPIEVIATGRSEGFREITIAWLKLHNVRYNHLVMRMEGETSLGTKRNAIRKFKPRYFIESDPYEAKWLFAHTNCPVVCVK